MSKRAEEAGLKSYPEKIIEHVEEPGFVVKEDLNRFDRNVYIQGYEKAGKDLALTWEDIRKIMLISQDITLAYPIMSKEYCEEVLRRFNETRK